MPNSRRPSTEDVKGKQPRPAGAAGDSSNTNTGDHCQAQPADTGGVTARGVANSATGNEDTGGVTARGVAHSATGNGSGHRTNTVVENVPKMCPGNEPLSTENDANVIRTGALACMDTSDINENKTPCKDATNLTKIPENTGNQATNSSGVTVNRSESMDTNRTPDRIFPKELKPTSMKDIRRNCKDIERHSHDLGAPMKREEKSPQTNVLLQPQMYGTDASEPPPFRRKLDFSCLDSKKARPRLEDRTNANDNHENTAENAPVGSHSKSLKRNNDTCDSADAMQESKRMCTKDPSPERTRTDSSMREASTSANAKAMSDQTPTQNKASTSSQGNGSEIETSNSSLQAGQTASPSLDVSGRAVQEERHETKGSVSPTTEQTARHQDARLCSAVQEKCVLHPDTWQQLRLDDCQFVYAMRNVRSFTRMLQRYGCAIQSLTVSSLMPTTDWQVKHIVGLMPRFCFNIKELTVDFPDLTETVLWRLVLTNKLQKLKILRMFAGNFESLLRCIMPLDNLEELEIHLGDEIEVDLDRNSSDLILDLGLFFRRNPYLTTVKLFFTVTTDMVRSILKHCCNLTHLELDVRDASDYLYHAAFAVPHAKLRTLILRSWDLHISDTWLHIIRNSFPFLCSLELAGRHAAVTRRRDGPSGDLHVTNVTLY